MHSLDHQAKEVICQIIAAAGGELHRKVALFKAFYYAHLYYWSEAQGTLTDYPIVRTPQGPGIENASQLLEELEQEGRISMRKEQYGPYAEVVYALARPYTVDPANPRYKAVEKAVKFIEGKSAAELNAETLEYSRSWQTASDGEELDIYIDLLDEKEFLSLKQRLQETEEMVNRVFAANV
jgi:hypothetical protein